jgi:hypothetical protein
MESNKVQNLVALGKNRIPCMKIVSVLVSEDSTDVPLPASVVCNSFVVLEASNESFLVVSCFIVFCFSIIAVASAVFAVAVANSLSLTVLFADVVEISMTAMSSVVLEELESGVDVVPSSVVE